MVQCDKKKTKAIKIDKENKQEKNQQKHSVQLFTSMQCAGVTMVNMQLVFVVIYIHPRRVAVISGVNIPRNIT